MSEINLDDDMESSAMMEAMGFAGFGMQPSAKKRKFNPHADASISGTLPKKPTAASSTGANTAPLGTRRLPPASASLPARPSVTMAQAAEAAAVAAAGSGNADEIDLGEEDEEDEGVEEGGGVGSTVGSQDEAAGTQPGPPYIDTSRPSRGYLPEELADMEMQGKIDAIVATQMYPPGLSAHATDQVGRRHQQQPQALHHAQKQSTGRGSRRTGNQAAGPGTAAADPWWEGYSDAKMNENPWERLERQKGLEPRGTWISRDCGAGAEPTGTQTSPLNTRAENGKDVEDEEGPVPEGTSLQAGADS